MLDLSKPSINKNFLYVCRNGYLDIAKWCLLQNDPSGAKSIDLNEGLACACSVGNLEVAKWCVSRGATGFQQALYSAVSNEHFDLAEWCINSYEGALDLDYVFENVVFSGNLEVAKWCLSQESTKPIDLHKALLFFVPFTYTTDLYNLCFEYATKKGIELKLNELTIEVCKRGHLELAKLCHRYNSEKIDLDACLLACCGEYSGGTREAEPDYLGTAGWLLSMGPTESFDIFRSICSATKYGKLYVISLLLTKIFEKDVDYIKLLFIACEFDQKEIIKYYKTSCRTLKCCCEKHESLWGYS